MTQLEHQQKIASDLRSKGFEVKYEVRGDSGTFYDMTAQREGEAIVFEFKPQSTLILGSTATSRLRQMARQDGYQDFRLVVVPEERPKAIEIAGLDQALLLWLQTHPDVVAKTPLRDYATRFQNVALIEVDSLSSKSGHPRTQVAGMAVAEFVVTTSEGDVEWDCPLGFDVQLDANWQLESVQKLALDVSSISEYLPALSV